MMPMPLAVMSLSLPVTPQVAGTLSGPGQTARRAAVSDIEVLSPAGSSLSPARARAPLKCPQLDLNGPHSSARIPPAGPNFKVETVTPLAWPLALASC